MKTTLTISFETFFEIAEFFQQFNPEMQLKFPEKAQEKQEEAKTVTPAFKEENTNITVVAQVAAETKREHKQLAAKKCATCGKSFIPNHNRTQSCDTCRSKKVQSPHSHPG